MRKQSAQILLPKPSLSVRNKLSIFAIVLIIETL